MKCTFQGILQHKRNEKGHQMMCMLFYWLRPLIIKVQDTFKMAATRTQTVLTWLRGGISEAWASGEWANDDADKEGWWQMKCRPSACRMGKKSQDQSTEEWDHNAVKMKICWQGPESPPNLSPLFLLLFILLSSSHHRQLVAFHCFIIVFFWGGVKFYGISTIVDYLIPNSFYTYILNAWFGLLCFYGISTNVGFLIPNHLSTNILNIKDLFIFVFMAYQPLLVI